MSRKRQHRDIFGKNHYHSNWRKNAAKTKRNTNAIKARMFPMKISKRSFATSKRIFRQNTYQIITKQRFGNNRTQNHNPWKNQITNRFKLIFTNKRILWNHLKFGQTK